MTMCTILALSLMLATHMTSTVMHTSLIHMVTLIIIMHTIVICTNDGAHNILRTND